tara:strand:+ start:1641 stop:2438 length:798 start_codon:yes stop_codon:yes gene_type:complete
MDSIIRKHSAKKQKKNYFTKETEQAIVRYNNEKNFETRSNIYQKEIHYPFFKLTQNIIHTFKFYHTEVENLEDLQHEIMIFLLDKIHLFNPENGAKAYSYFGTIVKRWLIVYTTKNYNKKLSNIPITDLSNYSNLDMTSPSFVNSSKMDIGVEKIIEGEAKDELDFAGYKSSDKLSLFVDQYVDYITDNIYDIFPKPYDAQIADAILELFRKRDNIDIFNKKALYIYIREQVDVKTPKITKIANILSKIFKEKYLSYLETGAFPS